jgi:uncharacterized SAM-binding protein YcdF (DUF218 family)
MHCRRRGLVLPALLLGGVLLSSTAGPWLMIDDPLPTRSDAIVVLAGSPPARLMTAADLYAAGVAPLVVLTRERRSPATVQLAERGVVVPEPCDQAARQLQALGVPAAALLVLHGRAHSTTSEARLIAGWACRTGRRSLVVVTSPSHTRRARLILRQMLGPGIHLSVEPAKADFFPRRRWWRSRGAAKLVLSEYQKLAHYWLREHWHLRACER